MPKFALFFSLVHIKKHSFLTFCSVLKHQGMYQQQRIVKEETVVMTQTIYIFSNLSISCLVLCQLHL